MPVNGRTALLFSYDYYAAGGKAPIKTQGNYGNLFRKTTSTKKQPQGLLN